MTQTPTFNNWKHIYESLSKIHSSVEAAQTGLTPKGSLTEALYNLQTLRKSMEQQTSYKRKDRQVSTFATSRDEDDVLKLTPSYENKEGTVVAKTIIPNIGSFNTARHLTVIANLIQSVLYPLEEKEKTVKQLSPVFDKLKESIKTLADEVVTTVDNVVLDNYIAKASTSLEPVTSEQEFDDLSEAMKDAAKSIAELQRSEQVDKSTSRDIMTMTKIVQNNNRDLENMQKHVRNAMLGQSNESFTVLRGPVITDSQLDIKRLASGNVDYDTVFYPGAKRAIGSSIGSSAKEPTPRMFILRDQLLVAIMLDSEKRFQLKLNKTPFQKKLKQSDADFARLRGDIVDLLSQKLNYSLVDVTAQREPPYFTSSKFPRIRFIWLLRQSTYDRLGKFNVGIKTGMPF